MFERISNGFVLRRFGKRFDGADRISLSARNHAPRSGTARLSGLFSLCCLALIAIAVLIGVFHTPILQHLASLGPATGVLFVGDTALKTPKAPAKIREMEANMKALGKELEIGQQEMVAGPISQARGEELEEKAKEMEELQEKIDLYNRVSGTLAKSREVKGVTLPDTEAVGRKRLYTTPGHLFVASEAFKKFPFQGNQGWSGRVDVGKALGKNVLLTGQDAVEFETKAFSSADLPNLGADSIIPYDRDPELVRYAEPEILTIRQFLTAMPTTSDAVKYVKYTTTQRAAGTQVNRGDLKEFLRLQTELLTVNVETIAVLSKVTEQDIDDAPRLVGLINGEMTLDVKVEEERQITWGSGSGELAGLFKAGNGVPEFNRALAGDSVIDVIRKMRTDLRKRRVFPNFVAIDPLDWESVELAKGTTSYYIWGLVSDMRGPRIWSLPAVESDAMTNLETGERRVLIGDGTRGATIYDRMGVQLAVGFMDDDFGRNLRTLRCEERLALAVKRAFAFEYFVTDEPAS
jgi:HK97 family phage major capsid protein